MALVTGSSRGLGLAIAHELGRAGYAVILNGRDLRRLEEVSAQFSTPVALLLADVAEPGFGRKVLGLARQLRINHIDVVVHNAGINHMGRIGEIKPANAERTFHTNTFSLIHVAQGTEAWLASAREPRFVLVSSLMQHFAMPGRSVYAASKAAAEMFARAWAQELKAQKSRIRVQIFRPAGIETNFHHNTPTDGAGPRSNVSRMPPEKVARYVMKLIRSKRSELAPGFGNRLVAFVARHLPALADYIAFRRYSRHF
ncbi:MAG TPA: SDR family oxidoreductase [Turneriella sp.]|nr:SDR family oxidoreductase [Turneriella sp.]HNA79357.1 SDR family oxidoreductase [Turneriella sp.]